MNDRLVYIAMSTDFIGKGHINIIEKGREYGKVVIGLLTDEAIASYKRAPLLDYAERKKIIENIKGVEKIVPQYTLDYTDNLNLLRPDYVIHGDDWKSGIQSQIRNNVIKTLSEWSGKLIEIPYTYTQQDNVLSDSYHNLINTTDYRRAQLRKMLKLKPYIRVLEASSGLAGLIVENTKYEDQAKTEIKEFDAMWVSSLCDSTFKGKPDIELIDLTSRINTINEIMEVTTKPILFDGDTGSKTEHFVYSVRTLERLGVSAIVIEDKKGLKKNSLLPNEVKHELEEKEVFAEKIKAGKRAQITRDFMIFARLESLIADGSVEDALDRAICYINAGADGIMIHSKNRDGNEVFKFLEDFRSLYQDIPVILVPTTFNQFTEDELYKSGANIIIYANHLLRSAYLAMTKAAQQILKDGKSEYASEQFCVSIEDILHLIPGGKWLD